MIVTPHRHRPGHELADLSEFLAGCRLAAVRGGAPVLASVTLGIAHIDPLAVLLKMRRRCERSYYRECPAEDIAVAALDVAAGARFSGSKRFANAEKWIHETIETAYAAGDQSRAFAGPHAFVTAQFDEDSPLDVFFPARMVARHNGEHTAVANILVDEQTDPAAEASRMIAAHARFAAFDYGPETDRDEPAAATPTAADFTSGEPAYAGRVSTILAGISRGTYIKVVPARAETRRRETGFDTTAALEWLRAKHPSAHTFFFTDEAGAEWIGATPETLLRANAGSILTESLAGTGPRARHAAEDAKLEAALLSDEKVRREQQLVTDTIKGQLESLGLTPEIAAHPRIVRLAYTRHLRTPLRATLPTGIGALSVAGVLHPTPAVAGCPRVEALAALRETHEPAREHYAGASGWINAKGDAHLTVNLRCAKVQGALATLFAGAGIVAGSNPGDEAGETSLKLRTMAEALVCY